MTSFPAILRFSVQTDSLSMWQKENYAVAWRYELYFIVLKTIFYPLAAVVRKILFLRLENIIHILARTV